MKSHEAVHITNHDKRSRIVRHTLEHGELVVSSIGVRSCDYSDSNERPPTVSGPSKRYGVTLLIIALLLLIGETGPRPTDVQVHLFVMLIYGSLGLVEEYTIC